MAEKGDDDNPEQRGATQRRGGRRQDTEVLKPTGLADDSLRRTKDNVRDMKKSETTDVRSATPVDLIENRYVQ